MESKRKVATKYDSGESNEAWRAKYCENYSLETVLPQTLLPVNSENPAPIIFEIKAQNGHFIDGSQIKLSVRFKIHKLKNDAWTNLEQADNVAVINNALHSLFSERLIFIDNGVVESTNLENQRVQYLKNLLWTTEEEKRGRLQSAGWYPDFPGTVLKIKL